MTSGSSIWVTDSSGEKSPIRISVFSFAASDGSRGVRHVFGRFFRTVVLLLFGSTLALAGPVPLTELLSRTGRAVEEFGARFAGVTCTETVSQLRLRANGKILYQQESVFDYLVLTQKTDNGLRVSESRLPQRQSASTTSLPLLATSGFSTFLLIFHPYYLGSFEYQQLADDVLDGRRVQRVGFQHIRGSRTPTALRWRKKDYSLELRGTAWIDPDSGAIVRIAASLASPMEDVGLRGFQSMVQYAPVRFEGVTDAYWLPQLASVDVLMAHQHWHNTHRFEKYRRFSVSTQTKVVEGP